MVGEFGWNQSWEKARCSSSRYLEFLMSSEPTAHLAEIFVAEDNRADVYLIRKALEDRSMAYRLHVAEDGEQAAAFLKGIGKGTTCPDLFLLDLNLPRQDGHVLLQQLRDHPD